MPKMRIQLHATASVCGCNEEPCSLILDLVVVVLVLVCGADGCAP